MWGDPLWPTVSYGERTRKDTDMKLLYVFATILAISLAETDKEKREIADSESAASVELLREAPDLKAEASAYNTYVPPNTWNQPSYPAQNTWYPPSQPVNTWNPPQEPVNTWNPPKEPVNTWNPPKEPVNTWNPPKEPVKPWNPPVKPVNTWVPPVQNDQIYVHPTYPPVQNTWSTPQHHPPTTTTPLPVIKNEQHFYDNGAYKYEYQIGDGTHVGEEGYYTDPKQTDESLVKKGWYSFVGADGKTYTVTYWADKTGFHAYGDHLPTPPPVPAAIQAALDKEKEAEKYTTQAPHYPTQATYIPPNKPSNHVHNPTGYYPPTHYPTQQNQPSYYPPQQNNHNYG